MNNIFVYIENEGGKAAEVCLELMTKGRELATTLGVKLEAVVLGENLAGIEHELAKYGADTVWIADDKVFAPFRTLPHTAVMCGLIEQEKPQIVRKFTVEDKAGKQGARHAHASVNGQINAAQHNDKGQSQGHYQGQGHLVENIHNILGGEEAGPTDNEKDNHKTGQHDQRCQLHHFCAAVFTLDAFGELFRDGRRRI